ncbi:MAG TPA: gamma-glutamyltransferase [Bacillota bacterium]|nr:gamma-glutamyltransferase [Bacillota bacterium]
MRTIVTKEPVFGRRGMVAAKHELAAAAGIEMLRRGGNAIDAAVATALAVGVVEPWMNGLGGCGYLVYREASGATHVVEYGVRAPMAARPDMFPLAGPPSADAFFPWPAVRGDINSVGPLSVAVPGTPAGLALAAERFGSLSLRELAQPAIRLARDGFPVDWYSGSIIARDWRNISRYPATAATFGSGGFPLGPGLGLETPRIRQPQLADTLGAFAEGGARAFYEGEAGADIAATLQAGGGILTREDLAAYRARVTSPAPATRYRGVDVAVSPALTGAPTLVAMLEGLEAAVEASRMSTMDPDLWVAFGRVAGPAFRTRFTEYGDREGPGASTTTLSTVDAAGNAVALTQTLLGGFGSRVLAPGCGVLLNNGMNWFDPEPGKPNSVAGGRRPLSNMAPLVAAGPKLGVAAIGSSGGRRIMCTNANVLCRMVDQRMGAQSAVAAPRADFSGAQALVDERLGEGVRVALEAAGIPAALAAESYAPKLFASPCVIRIAPDGTREGGVDPFHWNATVMAEEE